MFKIGSLAPNTIHVFTDGSCYPNPGPGGFAAVLLFNGHVKEVHGGFSQSTNNEMELWAIKAGLEAIKTDKYPVIVYSDSQYAINAVSVWYQGWEKKGWKTNTGTPVKNVDVIKQVIAIKQVLSKNVRVTFKWVKGHVGIEHNERADFLAGEARKNNI